MLKALDRRALQILREDLQAALKVVSDKHGIQIEVGRATFTPKNATFKVEIATVSEDGTANTQEATNFIQFCSLYDLKPEHLGAEFTFRGDRYKVAGLASGRSHKFPILADRIPDGKTFKFPAESVVRGLTGTPQAAAPVLAPATAEERRKVNQMIADLKRDNPEAYYADGERKEQEAYRACFDSFLREIRGIGISALFAAKQGAK
jgi:hypothetical protein